MRQLHLVCNAHLDPVWLWKWEEGAAEALSTFRIAAEFCESYDGFVFNHNEAVLYEWIEEYDPALFARIQDLVRSGRWHIMGGWYLQPDCNMPSGEGFVRQALYGRRYFADRFGMRPTTAINFDPFGHSRGLVQILKKSGYDSYLFCRPSQADAPLPAEEFTWVGFDGSTVRGHRAFGMYLSGEGKSVGKIERYLAEHGDEEMGILLWGIGDHGGGPSRRDIEAIAAYAESAREQGLELRHSTPEDYFDARRKDEEARGIGSDSELPTYAGAINPWAPGCYTSQIRVKMLYRELENRLFAAEKMATEAALSVGFAYPSEEFREITRDLLFTQFHDILPGSSIPEAEEAALHRLGHGLELASRVRARAFFALTRGEPAPSEKEIAIFAHNPHPYPIAGPFEVEFQPADQNWDATFTSYDVRLTTGAGENRTVVDVPVQFEKEASSVDVDWRKKLVVDATLPPGALCRFDCTPKVLPAKPAPQIVADDDGAVRILRDRYSAVVGADGALSSLVVDGSQMIADGGLRLLAIADSDDAWESTGRDFRNVVGVFRPAEPEECAEICGVSIDRLPAVRVIEDGPVRTVVEAVLVYDRSHAVVTYSFGRHQPTLDASVRVIWAQKHTMLKLSIPSSLGTGSSQPTLLGQTAFGVQRLVTNGEEATAQRWVAVVDSDDAGDSPVAAGVPKTAGPPSTNGTSRALTVVNNGIYGCSMEASELRLTLLRSPAYSALPARRPMVVLPGDRFAPRMEQGERLFRFRIAAGTSAERLAAVDREAAAFGETPMLLATYPPPADDGGRPGSAARESVISLADSVITLSALKPAEDGDGYVVRLFEPTGMARTTTLRVPALGVEQAIALGPFEAATFRIKRDGSCTPTNLVEDK